MKLLVTGASGYIGRRVMKLAMERGHEVVAASRKPLFAGVEWVHYELDSPSPPTIPTGTRAIIHLAADTSGSGEVTGQIEQDAAKSLLSAARVVGARVLFVSSQTARENAPTAYGRTKWMIEQQVLAAGGWVIRPGQVYGGAPSGLFGVLIDLVRSLPVLPAFVPSPKIQPIHVDDLAQGLLDIAERDDICLRVLVLASPYPVTFTSFLKTIARGRVRRLIFFLPMPRFLVAMAALALPAQLRRNVGIDRLKSLFELPVLDSRVSLLQLGLSLRPTRSGMHPTGNDRRRRLVSEAFTLLAYLLKSRPATAIVRRYVRAVESLKCGAPLSLPEFMLRWPSTVALLDAPAATATDWCTEFRWRLNAATVLAEASPQSVAQFLGLGRHSGAIRSAAGLCLAVCREVAWRCAALLCGPYLRRAVRMESQSQNGI